jgi:hypothetical protein
VSQATVHRILVKNLCLQPYTLEVVQKLTVCNKQLRSQFAARVCAHILEHDNFFIDGQNFTYLDMSVGGTVIWDIELPR